MSKAHAVRAIGSDFGTSSAFTKAHEATPPWEAGGRPTEYVETGRQALSLIAQSLRGRGIDRLLVPAYLCESMIEAFPASAWEAVPYPLDKQLTVRPDELLALAHIAPTRTSVLFADYFGQPPSAERIELVSVLRASRILTIEDETHRVFRPGAVESDYSFASLRKLLPLADGAYLQGPATMLAAVETLPISDSARWAAMDSRAGALDEESSAASRSLLVEENRRLEEPGRLNRATTRTRKTLRLLDYTALAARRRANAQGLRRELAGFPGLSPLNSRAGEPDAWVVISVRDAQTLQHLLAKEGVYCPIHWPRPARIAGVDWRGDLISLPVDHRYGEADIARVAEAVRRVISK